MMTPVAHGRSRIIVLCLSMGMPAGASFPARRHDLAPMRLSRSASVSWAVSCPAIHRKSGFTVGDHHRTGEPCSPGCDDLRRRGMKRISTRRSRAAAIRRSIGREWPS